MKPDEFCSKGTISNSGQQSTTAQSLSCSERLLQEMEPDITDQMDLTALRGVVRALSLKTALIMKHRIRLYNSSCCSVYSDQGLPEPHALPGKRGSREEAETGHLTQTDQRGIPYHNTSCPVYKRGSYPLVQCCVFDFRPGNSADNTGVYSYGLECFGLIKDLLRLVLCKGGGEAGRNQRQDI
ncbi:uncharacterized protein AAGF69_009358 isoform 2-T3 [Amazona ochrocephala]